MYDRNNWHGHGMPTAELILQILEQILGFPFIFFGIDPVMTLLVFWLLSFYYSRLSFSYRDTCQLG
jgi:hypothetical protein